MKTLKNILLLATVTVVTSACTIQPVATVKEQLMQAKQENKNVFLVVGNKDVSAENLLAMANEVALSAHEIKVIKMDMSDDKNADIVKEYSLSGAPMPMILLLASSGEMLRGIVEEKATKDLLTEIVPTPKHNEMLKATSHKRPVFAIVTNNAFKSNNIAREVCEAAKNEMSGEAEVIIIDTEDETENRLVKMLNIKHKLEDTFIVVISGQGIMTGRFDTTPTTTEIIDAASHVVQNGCAPGGCTPDCD